MAKEFVDTVDFSIFQPVSSSMLNFGEVQTDESINFITQHSITISGQQLLELNEKSIFRLSSKIRGALAVIASGRKLKVDREDLDQLKEDDNNSLLHEQSHLLKIRELRPELVEKSSIHILPVLHEGKLKIAMNVETPKPEIDYSTFERALIMMAPKLPSDQDYKDLYLQLKSNRPMNEELANIRNMVDSKPTSNGKIQILKFFNLFI